MFYDVTTLSGSSSIIEADNSREAKAKLCKQRRIMQSDPLIGTRSITARKLDIDFPESIHRFDETSMAEIEGKDVLIFDSHHRTAVRVRAASVESIRYFLDEYSTVIIL